MGSGLLPRTRRLVAALWRVVRAETGLVFSICVGKIINRNVTRLRRNDSRLQENSPTFWLKRTIYCGPVNDGEIRSERRRWRKKVRRRSNEKEEEEKRKEKRLKDLQERKKKYTLWGILALLKHRLPEREAS